MERVTIYTDGAAEPNPGPAGYGVVLLAGKHRKELFGGFRLSTNNRMELLAVVVGLEALKKPCAVTVYSDSRYVVDAVEKGSVFKWRDNGWMRTKKHPAKNPDLWKRFVEVYERHDVELKWVKGHAGIEENERCDRLAVEAAKCQGLEPDEGYIPLEVSERLSSQPPASNTRGKKTKHTKEGEPCRKCGTALIKKEPKARKRKPGQSYYFEWYLFCPGCREMYMVEAAKRMIEGDDDDDQPRLDL